ncbi:ATP phosphoribosyltransferase regulatory subunit [Gracilibacillus caseinilyticus]|uniref:ATP phosphoribosyltransferase regulatory subunit n=1 Tax=Gracilibacillus caseinilyticus TaxID=2932256 RepID=A0ABY4EVN3_9BACI|nr:ATP phosphoribosyltransferase regulatory subunit [Gracilibacillus caseinilyticus]UOQ47714.1 ATP phosphoribosyltransferase regulatory subunit [Gracilibacillus caseinilyticus]
MFLPAGSQDETGNQISNRLRASEIFRLVTKKRNFKSISTPVVEYADTFTNDVAGMDLHSMLKWFNGEGEIEVLRPDWTAAVARAIAGQHPSEQKWSYQGSVFRFDKEETESRQAGIEIVHADRFFGEAESLLTAVAYLKNLAIDSYVIELGHTGIFETLITDYSFSDKQKDALLIAMHDKRADVVEEIVTKAGHEQLSDSLLALIDAYGSKEIIDDYRKRWAGHDDLTAILTHIERLIDLLEASGVTEVIVDLGRVKNLPYYDGIMFRGFLTNDGSTCFSGGRYDRLYEQFEQKTSAVGLAFYVDVLAKHMKAETEPEKICILASPKTHAIAEQFRMELDEQVVDIQYELKVGVKYHRTYQVVEKDNEYKVVER